MLPLMQLPLISTVWAALIAPFFVPQAPVVDLGYAKYQGVVNSKTGNVNFLGIRYAASPTGTLRWREPQPPQTTPGVQMADKQPNTCMQAGNGANTVSPFLPATNSFINQQPDPPPASEDCLFLNIAAPASGKGNHPVVVWIHPGGYTWGDAYHYSPEDLISNAGGNAVVVILQYRLGLFGFLSGQKVHDGGTLNAGLLDQQFAFRWIQEHISKFGGDPTKVALWGDSAGAGSIIQHLIANDGNTQPKLFRAGITSSTYLPPQYAYNSRIPEKVFQWVVEQTGCSSASDSLGCLRNTDVDILNQANNNITAEGFFGLLTFTPVVDGKFITDRPTVLLRRGKLNDAAIFSVTNRNESGRPNLVDPSIADTVKIPEYIANLWPELTQQQINQGAALYENASLGAPIDQAIAANSESVFVCPTYFLLRAMKGRAFKGEFAIPPAWHVNDLIYYFPNSIMGQQFSSPPFNNTEFRNNFAQSFLNFAISLDPNVKWDSKNTLPHWPRWTERGVTEMLFNKTESDKPVFQTVLTDAGLLRRCDYWESVGANSGQ
ncbi:hypothetical protein D9756_005152 [Leucocoprinus leucothites]|uniref:Carboxylic ester hydrolase n=1 Tax=Leucocoprinus leucothites TaxID=201217 RepID=A0A8H5LKN3_9AGAR|nr:hypothetical protein D9756_005152 [Leucoagaricus leucothites]